MTIYDRPTDFPSYQHLKVGDIFVWFVGKENEYDEAGIRQVHGHWFQVTYKEPRVAEISAKCLRCDRPKKVSCNGAENQEWRIGWSKLQHEQHKTRWLRTPASKVLFGERLV